MGIHDREYVRQEAWRARPGLPPGTKWLLILNLGIFVLDLVQRPQVAAPGALGWGPLNRWGRFTIESGILQGRLWELVTFQFLHDGYLHVIFNCVGIYFFGQWVERWWGTRRFFLYYLLCGVAGGLFFTLLFYLHLLPKAGIGTPLVGASAGVFGLIFGVYRIAPDIRVRLLFPPVEMSMRTLALALGSIACAVIVGGLVLPGLFHNEGGEAGHLGGALMGLLLMRFPGLLGRPGSGSGGASILRPKAFRRKPKTASKLRPRTTVDVTTADEVDRILDKVSAKGFGSLTEEEKKTLERASKEES